ncbi:ribulosamine/erythrulosamine 3-kinase [Liquorilactobacillus sucicola DSM 21376 = JCM 15457]|uniref:Fructosamine-3-kinase n=1 Tax=Liquorilactobacillus sucicola DSM 21376 = JCM 15457 TaxID=1423806 RepID=A0A023CYX6_9LACO|nr:fructosamine kinase family protein [Liquorilactobacillus sucicola]KRN07679.1 fructosamine-3-kinase [Liquorilactobacillus sucicola DSM 21376 = JCM 15457]GAJ26685.1 ribulosamine/erythrulosamine 3-kinase [Liquorilactobacillus sucicola DSM 21376 = JCM 15457]
MKNEWLAQLPLSNIRQATPVSGGDVNQAFRLETKDKQYFLLVQPRHDQTFYAGEIAGLHAFEEAKVLAPHVIASGQINGDAYLLLNFLETGFGKQEDLGRLVAQLHQYKSPNGKFGFDFPYAGTSVSFENDWTDSWSSLFLKRRLDVLAGALQQQGLWQTEERAIYQDVRKIIVEELAAHKSVSVLLHGDLWGGNYMFLADGRPALIDPAAFYGDREFDIAITTVFGGFNTAFYRAYQKAAPLAKGYEKRFAFYRLYYLMVHLNKFGQSYAQSVQQTMRQIKHAD